MNAVVYRAEARHRLPWSDRNFQWLVLSTATSALGNGVFAAISFLYYTRVLDKPATLAGAVLTAAGVVAIVGGTPLGRLVDRGKPASINAILLVLQAAAIVGIIFSRATVVFVLVAGGAALVGKLKLAARGALFAIAFTGENRMRVRGSLRSVSNLGIGLGSGAAAVVVSSRSSGSYKLALLMVGCLYLLAAWPMSRMKDLRRPAIITVAGGGQSRTALRDHVYVAVAALNGLLGIHFLLIQVGIPIWLSQHASLPLWLVSAGLIINTTVVAAATLPISPMVESVRAAVRAEVVATVLITVACVLFGIAGATPRSLAIILAMVAVLVYSFGEVLQATAAWQFSFDLADPNRPGEYQGVFASGASAGPVLAPLVISSVLVNVGDGGWLVLGAGFLVVGAAHPFVLRRRVSEADGQTPIGSTGT